MNRYQRALRERVSEGIRFRQTHGRPPTQAELGPMPVPADFPGLEVAVMTISQPEDAVEETEKVESLSEKRARAAQKRIAVKRAKRRAECGLVGVSRSNQGRNRWEAQFTPDDQHLGVKRQKRRFWNLINACQWRNAAVEAYYGPDEREDLKCDMEMIYRKYGKYA